VACPFLLPQLRHVHEIGATPILIAATVVLDMIFRPKENWKRYSRATDYLYIAKVKLEGQYDKVKELLDLILKTESQGFVALKDIEEIVAAGERPRG